MCIVCGVNTQIDYTVVDARGSRRLCPNHIIQLCVEGRLSLLPSMKIKDELRGEYGAVKISAPCGQEEYALSVPTARRLINHSLYVREWKALARNCIRKGGAASYSALPYLLHDDFYSAGGEALQPVIPNPELTKLYKSK